MKRKLLLLLFFLVVSATIVKAQSLSEVMSVLNSYLSSNLSFDKNGDSKVNLVDAAWIINQLNAPTPTSGQPTPIITYTPPPGGNSWAQLGGNAQRTGYTPEQPGNSWSFAWHWKPADMYSMPKTTHAFVGGGKVFMPGGAQGLYAVNLSNGSQAWRLQSANFPEAGAYDESTGNIFIAGTDNKVYKVSSTGSVLSTFTGSASFDLAVALVGNYIYAADTSGNLYKIDKNSMSQIWRYSAGQKADTPPSYSASRQLVIYGTRDLKTHAVRDSNGTSAWVVKPTSLQSQAENSCSPFTYRHGWPVVADSAGVVFMRIRLGSQNDWLYSGRSGSNEYPATNSETRAWLDANPSKRPLFALSLDNGSSAFTPAVANGGVDGDTTFPCPVGTTQTTMGPMPVIKNINGIDFAYILFRNSQTTDPNWDERWDSHMGEMVLSNSAISGYVAGDLRFINFGQNNMIVSDEASPITVAGNTIFYAHWGLIENYTITDRSSGKGNALSNPISTTKNTPTIRRLKSGGGQSNRYTTGYLELFCDTRGWPGPGFWMYFGESDPPGTGNPSCSDYRGGMLPRYSFAQSGYIFHTGHGGDIFALKY